MSTPEWVFAFQDDRTLEGVRQVAIDINQFFPKDRLQRATKLVEIRLPLHPPLALGARSAATYA